MRHLPLAIVLAVTGCASYRIARPMDPPPEVLGAPPAGAARVCAIRPSYAGSGATMILRDNGRLVGATRWNGAFCWLAAPGGHSIDVRYALAEPLDKSTAGNFEDGGRYYLYEDTLFDGFDLDWIDETRAGRMMERCEYQLLVHTDTGEQVTPPSVIVPAREN